MGLFGMGFGSSIILKIARNQGSADIRSSANSSSLNRHTLNSGSERSIAVDAAFSRSQESKYSSQHSWARFVDSVICDPLLNNFMPRGSLLLLALILGSIISPPRCLGQASDSQPSTQIFRSPKPPDFNKNIYYQNKLEFSMEAGWLPINIPFVFDFLTLSTYDKTPLNYTLVPTVSSVWWQLDDVRGPSFLRGNWDATFGGCVTAIPRGPETHYLAYVMGIRRNFVQPNWRFVPYLGGRIGAGRIDAKGPLGVPYAQGQDFTFTLMLGSGVRYNFNRRYGISAGLNYMHVSNLYLSEPKYLDYGINVYGPMFGFYMRLGQPKRMSP